VLASLDVTSFDSFGELVIGVDFFFALNIMFCRLVVKAYLNLVLLGLGQMAVNLLVLMDFLLLSSLFQVFIIRSWVAS
jgi:hypothetical protein